MQRVSSPLIHRPFFWDAQIAALLIGPPLAAAWIAATVPVPLGWAIAAVLVTGSMTVAYGSFIEGRRLILNKKVIHNSSLPPLVIAVAGDFHVGPYRDADDVRRIVDTINAQSPDLILLPGDFLFDHHADVRALEPLKNLRARHGTWACIGNHDSGDHATLNGTRYVTLDRSDEVAAFLKSCGIEVLRDAWKKVETNAGAFAIAGVDGPWRDRMNLERTLEGLPNDLPVLLLAHNPDVVLHPAHRRAALIVSGHTHGGQIRLPLIGALHVPAETRKRYDQGIFKLNDRTTLAVTHGCGETLARARLLCPPEIMLLTTL